MEMSFYFISPVIQWSWGSQYYWYYGPLNMTIINSLLHHYCRMAWPHVYTSADYPEGCRHTLGRLKMDDSIDRSTVCSRWRPILLHDTFSAICWQQIRPPKRTLGDSWPFSALAVRWFRHGWLVVAGSYIRDKERVVKYHFLCFLLTIFDYLQWSLTISPTILNISDK